MGKEDLSKVLIVYGGNSTEHDISIITAVTIYKRYKLKNIKLELVYQTKDGRWFMGERLDDFKTYKNFDPSKFKEVCFESGSNYLFSKKKTKLHKEFRVEFVINCFHGGAGEDGRFSAFMECCKIPSSCSSSVALGVAMDKYLTKLFAISLDVPVVDFFNFSFTEWLNFKDRVVQQLMQFDFPVVVKPVRQGSSIGVSFVSTLDEFVSAVNLAFKFDNNVIVERAVTQKREFNCCLVRTSEGKILYGVDEPVADKVVITFKDKYLVAGQKGKTKLNKNQKLYLGMENQKRKSSGLSSKEVSKLYKMSRALYENLDMQGVVRFDYIFDTKKDKFYLGEINAIPGSLGYYFFDDINLLELVYNAGKMYWDKKFGLNIVGAPSIFN